MPFYKGLKSFKVLLKLNFLSRFTIPIYSFKHAYNDGKRIFCKYLLAVKTSCLEPNSIRASPRMKVNYLKTAPLVVHMTGFIGRSSLVFTFFILHIVVIINFFQFLLRLDRKYTW